MSETFHAPLGELLVQHGGMSEQHLRAALEEQRASGRPLGEIVVERGYVPAAMVAQALATQQGGLTKTEYGYATGWAQAVDERDRAIAELRHWAEGAHAAIAARDAEIERLAGGAAELDELRNALAEREETVATLEADLAAARTAAGDGEELAALRSERAAAVEQTDAQQREIGDLRRGLENAASRAKSLVERVDEAERLIEELHEAAAAPGDPWASAESHLLFVRRADGYELVERDGAPPPAGAIVDGSLVQHVAALGGKPCAYLVD